MKTKAKTDRRSTFGTLESKNPAEWWNMLPTVGDRRGNRTPASPISDWPPPRRNRHERVVFCDRCGAVILGNRSHLQATRGELAFEIVGGETALADGVDLCQACAARFLDWLRSGNPNLANHAAPGGVAG